MDICVFDMLHTNNRGVTPVIDLSEIEDSPWTFLKLFEVGFFFSYMKYSHVNQIIEYDFALRIFGRFSNI